MTARPSPDVFDRALALMGDEAIRRRAYENEIVRRRRLNNIPDGFLTPDWLELAIAKDWTLVRGEPSETRRRAEAQVRAECEADAKARKVA